MAVICITKTSMQLALGGLVALAAGSALAGVQVQTPAVFEPGASFVESVRQECAIERMVGDQVLQAVQAKSGRATPVTEVSRVAGEPYLRVTIRFVMGIGGGGWSGPKSIGIQTELVENGHVVAKQVFRDSARGAPFAGTCRIMESIANTLGGDVAEWLVNAPRQPAPGTADSKPAVANAPARTASDSGSE